MAEITLKKRYKSSSNIMKELTEHSDWSIESIIEFLNSIEDADVEEVKYGKWEINCDGYYPYCSNCMTEPKSGAMSKYCPECGAKMDGGAK